MAGDVEHVVDATDDPEVVVGVLARGVPTKYVCGPNFSKYVET